MLRWAKRDYSTVKIVSECGVKSNLVFCLGPSIERIVIAKQNATLHAFLYTTMDKTSNFEHENCEILLNLITLYLRALMTLSTASVGGFHSSTKSSSSIDAMVFQ